MSSNLLAPINWLEIILRLGCACFFGALIGWDRQAKDKPAGLRTHMLVSLGSALFTLIPIQLTIAQTDPNAFSRIVQGIITGVGFLGAGEIFREPRSKFPRQYRIRGLTSAAAIWISASLGIIAGSGLWKIGLIAVLMTWLILAGIKKIEP